MSISRAQQILVKRAQREAGLEDLEYREALASVAGCRSTTDPSMTDRGVDLALAYFEAIYWRKVDSGILKTSCKPDAVFKQKGYWAAKNPKGNTSRDRYNSGVAEQIAALEHALAELGFGPAYSASIRKNTIEDRNDEHSLYVYRAALDRTLRSKRKRSSPGNLEGVCK